MKRRKEHEKDESFIRVGGRLNDYDSSMVLVATVKRWIMQLLGVRTSKQKVPRSMLTKTTRGNRETVSIELQVSKYTGSWRNL